MRKVLIEKVGSTTRVTTWDTRKPDKKVIKSYNQGANTLIENDVLIVEDLNNVFPKQRILFSELDENYGTTDIETFGEYLDTNGFFLVSGGSNGGSVVIVENYDTMLEIIANEELIQGATYEFPYRSVNYVHGQRIMDNIRTGNVIPAHAAIENNYADVHIGEEEILIAKALNSEKLEPIVYSKKYTNDIINFNPYVTKIGGYLSINNGAELSNSNIVSDFDLKYDSVRGQVYFDMPVGYPINLGHFLYIYAEFQREVIDNEIVPGQITDFSFTGNSSANILNGVAISKKLPKVNPLIAPTNPSFIENKVPTTSDGNGVDLFLQAFYEYDLVEGQWDVQIKTGFSPNGYQDLMGNSYAVGDTIYFDFDGEAYSFVLEPTHVFSNLGAKIIDSYTSSNIIAEGASFNVFTNNAGLSYDVSLQTVGMNYQVGDTLLITGDNLNGLTPLHDLTITIQGVTTNVYNENYYQDGCFEPIENGINICQYPYTSDDPDFGYLKKMSRIEFANNNTRVYLIDLEEADVQNYILDSLYIDHIEALNDAYGWINRRTDTEKNIDTPFDFRNQKYRRWLVTNPLLYGVMSVDSYISIDGYEPGSSNPSSENYLDFKVLNVDGYDCHDVYIDGNGGPNEQQWYSGTSYNNVFSNNLRNLKINQRAINNTLHGNVSACVFTDMQNTCSEQSLSGVFSNSIFELRYTQQPIFDCEFKSVFNYNYIHLDSHVSNWFPKVITRNEGNSYIKIFYDSLNSIVVDNLNS